MKPTLLFYCQHSVGIGHLMRSFALARALSETFKVIFLNGGPIPTGLRVPEGIEMIDLPPLGMADGHQLQSRDTKFDVERAKQTRRALILSAFASRRPDVLLIELFPFGRKKFAFELLPLLKQARRLGAQAPLVVSSVRDILVNARPDQQHHDDRAAWLCRRYFDAVLVHADERFARLEESFRPRRALPLQPFYTGFVSSVQAMPEPQYRERSVLVSAGGGMVGLPLLRTAIQAQALLPRERRWPMKIVAGPFLPDADWQALQQLATACEDVQLLRSVPNLAAHMHRAGLSISQCGYNTTMDLLASGVPALIVPYAAEREDEQSNRAARLARIGAIRLLPPQQLDAAHLAAAIEDTMQFRPSPHRLDLRGANRTAQYIEQLRLQRAPQSTKRQRDDQPMSLQHVA